MFRTVYVFACTLVNLIYLPFLCLLILISTVLVFIYNNLKIYFGNHVGLFLAACVLFIMYQYNKQNITWPFGDTNYIFSLRY